MDLQTIGDRVADRHYTLPEEFVRDVLLMLNNCRQFNGPGHFHEQADNLQVFMPLLLSARRSSPMCVFFLFIFYF